MYDPYIGRFVSEDPLGFAPGDLNLYRYCGNKPTTATDPSGLWPPDGVPTNPAPASLTNIQARDWYNARLPEIATLEAALRAEGKSLAEILERVNALRNQIKLEARVLMADRALAESLPPLPTAQQCLADHGGDYEAAIAGARRSNATVNAQIEAQRAALTRRLQARTTPPATSNPPSGLVRPSVANVAGTSLALAFAFDEWATWWSDMSANHPEELWRFLELGRINNLREANGRRPLRMEEIIWENHRNMTDQDWINYRRLPDQVGGPIFHGGAMGALQMITFAEGLISIVVLQRLESGELSITEAFERHPEAALQVLERLPLDRARPFIHQLQNHLRGLQEQSEFQSTMAEARRRSESRVQLQRSSHGTGVIDANVMLPFTPEQLQGIQPPSP